MADASQAAGFQKSQNRFSETRSLTDIFDMLAHQAQSELGNITQSAYFMGDGLQRAVIDGAFNLLRPQTWTPSNLWRLGSEAVRQSVYLSRLANTANLNLAWEELRNKIEVFILVKNLPSILKLPPVDGEFIPLPQLVPRAYALSAFQSLWAVEGLGHYYADSYYAHFGNPQGLLTESKAPVPDKSLLMLHAGMGLSFADRLIGDNLNPDDPSAPATRGVVQEFVSLCRNNARNGYLGAAIESLGLVTRDFYPELLNVVQEQLTAVAPELTGYFWHGAGRALYFSREYFLPVLTTAWHGIDEEARACPDRLSAMAGLAWALTVVNMRQPAVLQNALLSYTQDVSLAQGFANGVASTLVMRQATTPDEPLISTFYHYQPDPGNRESAELWSRFVLPETKLALEKYYPVLKKHNALEQVFRYQDLAALVSQFEGRQAGQEQLAHQG